MILTSDPQVLPRDLRADTSTQEFPLGAKASTADGRVFRYCKAGGTALVAGKVYDAPATVANHTNIAVASAASAGATSITVTLGATAATANQYAGGVIVINDVDGQGFTYTIKSHPAADASASLVLTLDDNETVVTALTTSSQATLVANQYNGVVIHAVTEASVPVGVAHTQITASQYGWIQTRGPVSVLINATTGIGLSVAASDTTNAGGAEVGDGILPVIGYAIAAGVATEYNPIFLTID